MIGISPGRSLSFPSRSLTLALATPATQNLGGDLSLVAVLCILSGIMGVLIGPQLLDLLRIPQGKSCSTFSIAGTTLMFPNRGLYHSWSHIGWQFIRHCDSFTPCHRPKSRCIFKSSHGIIRHRHGGIDLCACGSRYHCSSRWHVSCAHNVLAERGQCPSREGQPITRIIWPRIASSLTS